MVSSKKTDFTRKCEWLLKPNFIGTFCQGYIVDFLKQAGFGQADFGST
jgi:hypothetical protein